MTDDAAPSERYFLPAFSIFCMALLAAWVVVF